jgi:hypothetical protein
MRLLTITCSALMALSVAAAGAAEDTLPTSNPGRRGCMNPSLGWPSKTLRDAWPCK